MPHSIPKPKEQLNARFEDRDLSPRDAFVLSTAVKARSHGAFCFVCGCGLFICDFMKLFTWCDGCECDLLSMYIGITHCNHTE